ncbi:MAG: TadE/TadG family type IV pilus assembly protein [Armatimonadota bacterium]
MRSGRYQAADNSGSVSVEMALIAPVLIVLLLGILEFGLAIKDYLGVNQAAREAARAAAVGATIAAMDARLDGSAPTIDTSRLARTYEYRTFSEDTGTWSEWLPLSDVGTGSDVQNAAPVGAQVRVSVSYPHALLTGPLFARFADDAETRSKTLTAAMIMRRE